MSVIISNPKPLRIKIHENQVFVKQFSSSAKVTYKLAGADAKLFSIDANGRLKFKAVPDYETPRDQDRDNSYDVTLILTSDDPSSEPARRELRIEVGDKDETSKQGGSIGDAVWFDADGDGVRDEGEAGAAGVKVKLLGAGGKVLATTRTDADGSYLFDDLAPGSYKVRFHAPDGRAFTSRASADARASGSDSDASSSGLTNVIELGKGEKLAKIGAGLVKEDPRSASIGDTVFFDADRDGIRDAGEAGVAGVTVELLTSRGELIATTTTSANGKYIFSGLPAGNYRVKFVAPDGTEFTSRASVAPGDVNNDSDPNVATGITGVIRLGEGERLKKVDAGLVEADTRDASLGGTVWRDASREGLRSEGEPGMTGVTVELLDAGGAVLATATTGARGGYVFENLSAGDYSVRFIAPDGSEFTTPGAPGATDASHADATTGKTGTVTLGIGGSARGIDAGLFETDPGTASLGGVVWSDTSREGLRGGGEAGAAGVTVDLLGPGGAVLATSLTDTHGLYLFESLGAGDYRLRFAAPDGTAFTASSGFAPGTSEDDSDADQMSGKTGTISLSMGEARTGIDAGLVALDPGTASVGGIAWSDDGDGLRQGFETGPLGVGVTLLDSGWTVVRTTQTDSTGQYLFESLRAGDYKVRFDMASFSGRHDFSPTLGGAPDASDTDSDADLSGMTGLFTLSAGETQRGIDAGLLAVPMFNAPPMANHDFGQIRVDTVGTIDVLANDFDPEGGPLSVTSVDNQPIGAGRTITAHDGVRITLNGGMLDFDATSSIYAGIPVGEHTNAFYAYDIRDAAGGTALGSVAVTYRGAVNTLATIKASLPKSGAIVVARDMTPDGDFYDAAVSETGDARFDGLEFAAVYCIEGPDPINLDARVPVTFHLADEASVPAGAVANPQNLDMVNWILNQDFDTVNNGDGTGATYTEREIQGAIWGLTDDIVFVNETVNDGTTANAREIHDLALLHGEGFTPGEGDIVGIVAVPTPEAEAVGNEQSILIGIRYEDLEQDCLCL